MNLPALFVGGLVLYVWAVKSATNYIGSIEATVKKVRFRLLPPGGTLEIEFTNHNNRGIVVDRVVGSIVYNGFVVANFNTPDPIPLNPKQRVTGNLKITLLLTAINAVVSAIQGQPNLRFTVNGTVSAAGVDVPFTKEIGYELI